MEKLSSLNITFRKVLRVLSVLSFILFFCPLFSLAYLGQTIKISGFDVTMGIKRGDAVLSDPALFMLLCLALPVFMILFLFIKGAGKFVSVMLLVFSSCDFLMWFVVKWFIKRHAEENLYVFNSMFLFSAGVFFIFIIILLCLCLVKGFFMLDSNIVNPVSSDAAKKVSGSVKSVAKKTSDYMDKIDKGDVKGVKCRECGAVVPGGNRFCSRCGAPVKRIRPVVSGPVRDAGKNIVDKK